MANRRELTEWASEEQLVRAAWYYYVEQLTQDQIARRLSVSRASAGRLLEKSRRSGVVSFTINSDYLPVFEVGRRLMEVYGLRDTVVIPAADGQSTQAQTVQRLAHGAAQYLKNHLQFGNTLAMGWGYTVGATFELLPPELMSNVSTVTLTGGVDAYVKNLRRLRGTTAGVTRDWVIPTPILVSSAKLAMQLRAEDGVRTVIDRSHNADHAVIGIGGLTGEPTLALSGYASAEELERYAAEGAVGDVLGLFFDKDGKLLELPIHHRRIGIGIDELKAIPNVVGVAGGNDKIEAIRGALAGGYVDVLITTEEAARSLLGDTDAGATEGEV
ncbi:sugar-binding transcriptional regulator [Ornithinimicrobium faecis]|uniref:Sugar-binding transcriptional regulator n=1 Tax=Ornithinimicrobium faecis TaxID=2934158 RepID=A0ABY4YQW4_9MICO|nr:sugar-binding transcriptional regulator [Ornithinimicrobium sp. HY1793]USQ79162.1 sugar-binding transcriptional regulator [Ornithinimicrobium sp. HY1793]